MMTPRSTIAAVAEVWATLDGNLRVYLAERRLANISAGRKALSFFGQPRSSLEGGGAIRSARSKIPDYEMQAEEFARALEARGFAIVERQS